MHAYFTDEKFMTGRNKHAQVIHIGKGSGLKLSDSKASALDLYRTELDGSGDSFL